MMNARPIRFKPIRFMMVLVAMGMCCERADADILARYDFSGEPGDQVSTAAAETHTNLSASVLTRSSGLTARQGTNSMSSSAWSTNLTLDATDYYQVTLTPNAGCTLTLSNIYYRYTASATGASAIH